MMTNNLALRDLERDEMMEVNGGEPITIGMGLVLLGCAVAGFLIGRRAAKKD